MPALSVPPAVSAPAADLAAYRWRKRIVVVFATSPADPRLAQQRDALRALEREGDARDLILVTVAADRVQGVAESADSLRRRLHVPPGAFRAVLIGKDGGVKLSERTPLAAERLISTIDAMPMRQAEMRRDP